MRKTSTVSAAARRIESKARRMHAEGIKAVESRIKGKLIYINSRPSSVPARGQSARKFLSLRNAEWISWVGPVMFSERLIIGGFGVIFWGKVKFKGMKPRRVVLKIYSELENRSKKSKDFREIIRRLQASRVPQPKMALLDLKIGFPGKKCIVMEPFLKKEEVYMGSKFLVGEDVVATLRLENSSDQQVFARVAQISVDLAKAGLVVGITKMRDSDKIRSDAFNVLTSQKGEKKVYVQDLDTVQLSNETPHQNWAQTSENLLKVVASRCPENYFIAKQIIESTAQANGLVK